MLKLANPGKGKCGCLQYCPCKIFRGSTVFRIKCWGVKQSGLYSYMNTQKKKLTQVSQQK